MVHYVKENIRAGVCSDGTTEAQPRSFRQKRPIASTLPDIMHVTHVI